MWLHKGAGKAAGNGDRWEPAEGGQGLTEALVKLTLVIQFGRRLLACSSRSVAPTNVVADFIVVANYADVFRSGGAVWGQSTRSNYGSRLNPVIHPAWLGYRTVQYGRLLLDRTPAPARLLVLCSNVQCGELLEGFPFPGIDAMDP